MRMRADVRVEARADLAEQQRYVAHKREQGSQRRLDKLISEYTNAIAAFVRYTARAAPTLAAARAHLATLNSARDKQKYLREQIEMLRGF
eukprot:5030371-Pleurochrysis_carterae.AAC.1